MAQGGGGQGDPRGGSRLQLHRGNTVNVSAALNLIACFAKFLGLHRLGDVDAMMKQPL